MINKYISVICVTLICCFSGTLKASDMISKIAHQGETEVNLERGITTNTPVVIFLNNSNLLGTWDLEILTTNEKFTPIDCIDEFPGYCIIKPKDYNWDDALRDYDSESHRDYFIFRLSFTDKSGNSDEICFKWGLLPSKPQLSDVVYTYEYNWDDDMIYPNGDFSLKVSSTDADKYWLHWTYSFLFGPPYYFTSCCIFEAKDNEIIGYDADWGEFVNVTAQNQFGYVHSDTICTTDYITDPDILNRINEIAGVTGLEEDAEDPLLSKENDILTFKEPLDVNVYDISGKQVLYSTNAGTISLAYLNPGIYVITYKLSNKSFPLKYYKK